jgi:hypothetical protein
LGIAQAAHRSAPQAWPPLLSYLIGFWCQTYLAKFINHAARHAHRTAARHGVLIYVSVEDRKRDVSIKHPGLAAHVRST